MRKRDESEVINQVFINKDGIPARIIAYHSSKNVDIQFDNGEIVKHRDYRLISKGRFTTPNSIRLDNIKKEILSSNFSRIDGRNARFNDGVNQDVNGKWRAGIGFHGKSYHLGVYDTKEEAIKIRKEFESLCYTPQPTYENEEWRKIREFDNYSVSNYGRVKNDINDYIIIGALDKDGYRRVTLCNRGKQYNRPVHRLVAMEFLNNPDKLPVVNHKDQNVTNNCVDNLEWCTVAYNNSYMDAKYKRCKPVVCIETGIVYAGTRIAERATGISHTGIGDVCMGKQRHAGGFHWRYATEHDNINYDEETIKAVENNL